MKFGLRGKRTQLQTPKQSIQTFSLILSEKKDQVESTMSEQNQ